MSIDFDLLPPAPWEVTVESRMAYIPNHDMGGLRFLAENSVDQAALHFAALARNALDVQMRHLDWYVCYDDYWKLFMLHDRGLLFPIPFAVQFQFGWQDPLTAWVEGERWYRENVDAKA